MPEVIEPETKETPEYVPPQASESPKPKVNRGDVFRENLVKAQKAEREESEIPTPPEAPSKPDEPPTKEPEPPSKPEETPSKPEDAVKTPTSPLDVVTAEKKPEPKPEEPEDVLKDFDEKNPDWKRAREVMKTQSREKRELEKTIAELKKTPKSDPEEIARLTKEREDLKQSLAEREELISSIDVRLSKDYQDTVKSRDKRIAKVASTAKAYGADVDTLIGALNLPDGAFKTQQIKAAMAEVEPEDKTEIRLLIGEVNGYNEKLQEFEANAPTKAAELQAKREAEAREQQEASIKNLQSQFTKFMDQLPNTLITAREVPEDIPDGTKWNEDIRGATEKALRILTPGGSTLEETEDVAWKGSHYDALLNRYLALHSESKEMRQRLAEFDGGGPDFKGGNKPATPQKKAPGAQRFHEALAALKADPAE